jgi:hypothetical protein
MLRFIELSLTMQQDQFGRLLPTFIQVIDLTEQEESEYWSVISAVFEGRQVDSVTSRPSFESITSTSMEASINKKVCLHSPYYSESQLCLLLVSEYLFKLSNVICFMLASQALFPKCFNLLEDDRAEVNYNMRTIFYFLFYS